jgi:hypothetical protein
MTDKQKVETMEEFLARGGKVQVFPAVKPEEDNLVRPTTAPGLASLMSLDDGAHFFAEKKEKRTRQKKDPLKGINVDALPPEVRALLKI